MDEGRNVWVPDSANGYIIGRIVDIGTDTVTVEPRSLSGKTVTASYEQVFLSEEYEDKDVDDNCKFCCSVSADHFIAVDFQKYFACRVK